MLEKMNFKRSCIFSFQLSKILRLPLRRVETHRLHYPPEECVPNFTSALRSSDLDNSAGVLIATKIYVKRIKNKRKPLHALFVERIGIEPMTSGLQSRRSPS